MSSECGSEVVKLWRTPQHLLFWMILILGTVVVCELLVRIALPPLGRYSTHPQEDALLAPHATRGYALLPDATSHWVTDDYDLQFRINARGLRDEPFQVSLARDLRIVAVGDSYTMGLAVSREDRWTDQLQGLLGGSEHVAVINAGVPGYSARQMRQTAEELLPEVRPSALIFALYASSYWRTSNPYVLFGGTLVHSRELPYLRLADGMILHSRFEEPFWFEIDIFSKRFFQLGARLLALLNVLGVLDVESRHHPDSDRDRGAIEAAYRATLGEIKGTHDAALAAGASFILLLVNRQLEDGSFAPEERVYNDIVKDFCSARGIEVVDPLPRFVAVAEGRPVLRYPGDIHWTPLAHRIAAGEIFERIVEGTRLLATP